MVRQKLRKINIFQVTNSGTVTTIAEELEETYEKLLDKRG